MTCPKWVTRERRPPHEAFRTPRAHVTQEQRQEQIMSKPIQQIQQIQTDHSCRLRRTRMRGKLLG